MDTVLSIFDECTANGGSELACSDDISQSEPQSSLSYDVIANTIYYIAIEGFYADPSNVVLNIDLDSVQSCP